MQASALAAAFSARLAMQATFAPREASWTAMERPIPRLAPVTRATFPSRKALASEESLLEVKGVAAVGRFLDDWSGDTLRVRG